MPSRIILHLGVHKTATTSLQAFLGQQSKILLVRGVRYIPLGSMRSDLTPLLCNLSSSSRAALDGFIRNVQKQTLLLSDENILGVPGDIVQGDLYPFAENRIRTFCAEQKDRAVDLVLTLRAPADFLASLYCEYIRHNDFLDFGAYVASFDLPAFSYRRTFGWLFDLPAGVGVHVIPFESGHGGGVTRTAEVILTAARGPDHGIDLAAFPAMRSRASFSAEEIALAAQVAAQADPKTAQMLLNLLDARGRRFGTTRFAPLPADLAARLDEVYRADLAAFARLRRP